MSYLRDNFLLKNKTAEKLYAKYALSSPIIDYHCHLSEKQILENKVFNDVYEIWLSGDHYKWRLMRNCGVDENLITGKADNKSKFIAYCTALSTAFGNPLYHWSQIELKEFFNCELEINEQNAPLIWDWCNDYIAINKITPEWLINKFKVSHIFTTNEVFDDLSTFAKIKDKGYLFKVMPTFRADKIMAIESPAFKEVLSKLGEIDNLSALENVLEDRLKEFIKVGAKASDIAVEQVYQVYDKNLAEEVFAKRVKGEVISEKDCEIYKGYLTYYLFKLYAKYDIATEFHIGAMRNNNSKMFSLIGADTGYDSISDYNSIHNISKLFDRLESEDALPKTILFNLNPKLNAELIALMGCFQSAVAKGKMQYGPAWWFLDNKAGMEKHLSDLCSLGHIGAFIGMLTDSRSFLSYPRHHYFRRILCNFFGEMMENGEMTFDEELVGKVVEDICYHNAVKYFKV